jgi:hypothetical protein
MDSYFLGCKLLMMLGIRHFREGDPLDKVFHRDARICIDWTPGGF